MLTYSDATNVFLLSHVSYFEGMNMGVNTTNMGQSQLQLPSNLISMTGLSISSSSNQLNNVSGLTGGGSLGGGSLSGSNLNNNLSQQELLQLSMSRQSTPCHLGTTGGGGMDHTNLYHDASGGSPRSAHPHSNPGLSQSHSSSYLDYHLGGVDLSPTRNHGNLTTQVSSQ